MGFLCIAIQVYLVICVARVVMSWLDMAIDNSIFSSIAGLAYALTEPLFATVRRSLPSMGDLPIDLSPMVIILGLSLLQQLVCRMS